MCVCECVCVCARERESILCKDVPEDLWPEDAVDAGGDLVCGGGEDNQTGEVVFNELAHGVDVETRCREMLMRKRRLAG